MSDTNLDILAQSDPTVTEFIGQELQRQREHLELIASENFTSAAVLAAQGSVLTNKYAEGLPKKRYYGGCEFIDKIEQIAIDRACELFDATHANVQPHSGAQANFAVFLALLQPGDTIMGMDLSHGGHLTHGSPVNVSGKWFNVCHYGVSPETETLDYDKILELAKQHQPKLMICGYSAYPRIIEFDKFRAIADEVGAYLLADIAHIAGLVATGHHPNPLPHCHVVTTTTHKTLRGPRGGLILTRDPELGKKLDKAVFPGTQGGPLEHVIAGKAVAFGEALKPEFKTYSSQVIANAQALANCLQQRGLKIVSGGTDNHLMLVDLRSVKMTGKIADRLMSEINITANKNTVPFDPESPFVTSGLRLGSPAMTTRGMGTSEFIEIGNIIADRLLNPDDDTVTADCRARVAQLCDRFPLYPHLQIKVPALT
ncbi:MULTISPECIES: serine hydroxymethyltransferase [Arthrospira]|uniref:Serine hydroxymethyltransferase n=1 Tax=Limnospira platensis NIES-46 TaxID=1236695 RepID=A0A5M3T3F7_LIMPL|nr:serine hydroxymethyltransferase [Arthrospira platensis]AMW30159.1 serine hydroxymethyltransferase [Arthrospira platensis YZ]KDR54113.1 serine hydroxymethyltransferase [Arthrospira platensis str. Paraca]MDF2207944.1 serine hydroxymethyltransferase [Arthrospira platensis NCB002]MDT9184335.1 serine hydroxymethyltransferase [Limnospira sp. PMC 289.06]MDT9296545.1 serine hydroxymethyltransferase [Arthrospira platensis PCC 7345]MDT9312158.1 serine hydroxymethyltransferase [Limnospira sp. Paracas